MSVSVFWWHQQSMGCYLICFSSYLQLLFSVALLLGKLVWILNICKNVSILSGQLALGPSLPLFLEAGGNWCLPNCSQNTDVVGTSLKYTNGCTSCTFLRVCCESCHLTKSHVKTVWSVRFFDHHFWHLGALYSALCSATCWQNQPAWCLGDVWICDLCGLLMCEDGLTLGMFHLLREERGSTPHLKKLQGKGILHSFLKSLSKGVLAQ